MASLVQRWINVAKPYPANRINPAAFAAYARGLGDGAELEEISKKISLTLDQAKLNEIVAMHAQEVFAESVLASALVFLESPEGKAYKAARDRVLDRAQAAIMKYMGEQVRKALGEG
jgi:hypothetical protein